MNIKDFPKCETCGHYDEFNSCHIILCYGNEEDEEKEEEKTKEKIVEKYDPKAYVYTYSGQGIIHVEDKFGCIHHTEIKDDE